MKFIKFAVPILLISIATTATAINSNSVLACQKISQYEIPESSTQVVLVEGNFDKVQATLTPCKMSSNNEWQPVLNTFSVVVGKNGIAEEGKKKEGDGKTPSGLYFIGEAFGYSSSLGRTLKVDYRYVTPNKRDKFVDDVNSKDYNTWVTGPTAAKRFEYMRRNDPLYEIGAVIDYNKYPTIVKGAGSAIFMHIWRPERTGTAGCIAMDKGDLSKVLHWLDKNQYPQILIIGQ